MNNKTLFSHLRDLIARDELPAALRQLCTLLNNSPKLDEAILQSGRFEAIRREIRLGVVSHAEASLTQNEIRAGLLDLISEIKAQEEEMPDIRTEVEKYGNGITVIQNADKIYNINKIDNANFS